MQRRRNSLGLPDFARGYGAVFVALFWSLLDYCGYSLVKLIGYDIREYFLVRGTLGP